METQQNQRGYTRREISEKERCPIEYKIQGKSLFQKANVALTKNISASGILFISSTIYSINTVIRIKLILPGQKKPIKLKAKIVRVDRTKNARINYIAIHFTEIKPPDQEIIDQFCSELKSQKDEIPPDKDHRIYI